MEKLTKNLQEKLNKIIDDHASSEANLIPILLSAQAINPFNYISEDVATYVASKLDISLSRVSSLVSFYAALSNQPRGKNIIKLCKSTACLVNDYKSLQMVLETQLKIKVGQTTPCKSFSLEYTDCIGACDISPAIKINHTVYGHLTEEKISELVSLYRGSSHE